jgi:hypothetical protein
MWLFDTFLIKLLGSCGQSMVFLFVFVVVVFRINLYGY